jgi:hypothetical protein
METEIKPCGVSMRLLKSVGAATGAMAAIWGIVCFVKWTFDHLSPISVQIFLNWSLGIAVFAFFIMMFYDIFKPEGTK